MCANQNKIKNLPKIVIKRSRLAFTAIFLMCIVYGSQAFAMDSSDLGQSLLAAEEGRGYPVVSALRSVNSLTPLDSRGSGDGVGLSSVSQHSAVHQPIPFNWGEEGGDEDEEALYIPIDVTPADAEMDKIIRCIGYLEDGDYTAGIAEEFLHMGKQQLREFVIREGWAAVLGGPLTEVVTKLSTREGKLQARCRKLERDKNGLERDKDSFVKTCAAVLAPSITDIPALQGEIIKINEEAKASRTAIKYLKIALGAVTTTAIAGYVTILVLWHH